MTQPGKLVAAVSRCEAVLFDFDGPLCDVFSGYSAPAVAREVEELSGMTFATDDPLEVLRGIYVADVTRSRVVEDALISAEVKAVQVSAPQVDGIAAIHACVVAGLGVGIVSNNSAECVVEFLEQQHMKAEVKAIVGRPIRRPDLMKPNPWPLREALRMLHVDAGRTLLIGDSVTDVEAALAAGVVPIGYANKPGKADRLAASEVVITSMREFAEAVAGRVV